MVAAGARPRTPALFLVVVVSVATGCGSNTSSTPAEETSSSVATSTTSSPSYAEPTNSLPGGGRVLFNLERFGKPSQPAYIDETGVHIIPVAPDPTLAHVAWASERSILFDTERSGPRHIHRIDIDGSDDVQLTTGPESQDQGLAVAGRISDRLRRLRHRERTRSRPSRRERRRHKCSRADTTCSGRKQVRR